MGFGYGNMLGKIFDWIPGSKEYRRTKIQRLKREMDEITKEHHNSRSMRRYKQLANELRKIEEKAANAS